MLQRIKRINSHTGHARFLAQCNDAGYIDRQTDIPSPYAYSPTHCVYLHDSRNVIIVETAHKRFDVFAVPLGMVRATE